MKCDIIVFHLFNCVTVSNWQYLEKLKKNWWDHIFVFMIITSFFFVNIDFKKNSCEIFKTLLRNIIVVYRIYFVDEYQNILIWFSYLFDHNEKKVFLWPFRSSAFRWIFFSRKVVRLLIWNYTRTVTVFGTLSLLFVHILTKDLNTLTKHSLNTARR